MSAQCTHNCMSYINCLQGNKYNKNKIVITSKPLSMRKKRIEKT